MRFVPRRSLFTLAVLLLLSTGCDSGSDSDDDNGGDPAGPTYYGINAVNTGDSDLSLSVVRAFCEPSESDDACRSSIGASNATVFPGRSFLVSESIEDTEYDRVYVDWEVTAGEGRLELVLATGDDSNPTILETYEAIPVAAGDADEAFYSLD